MAIKLNKDNLVRNLAKKTKLAHHIDKALINHADFVWSYEYTPKESDDAWHPSGHCTPSPFELYHYAKSAEEERNDASMQKIFQVGHFWHQFLQFIVLEKLEFCTPEAIERRGIKTWGERNNNPRQVTSDSETQTFVDAKPFHWVTGSGDIAPCAIPGHSDYVVDFKTMGAHAFKPNEPPAWAADKWECQTNIYMDFFDLEKALIVGINKDTPHDFKEFEYHRNQPLIDAIYRKWELVSHCLDEGVEPPEDEVIELPLQGHVNG